MKLLVVVIVVLTSAVVLAALYGGRRFDAETERLTTRLAELKEKPERTVRLASELELVPPPVARFFRFALRDEQPFVLAARLTQAGEFRMSESPDSWKPFSARQVFRVTPPGFVWDARIRMAPGLTVRVRDSYRDGRGSMNAAVLGLVPVAKVSGTSDIAVAALQRYLAEAVWFPTALLPSQGVAWSPIDASTALAALTDGALSASLEFRFGDEGEIAGVFTEARNREVEGRFVPTPWEGVFRDYETRSGMRVPGHGEVAWIVESERRPYWRGRILDAVYDFGE